MEANLKLNPLYCMELKENEIRVKSSYSKLDKYIIRSKNADILYKEVLKKIVKNQCDVKEVIKGFDLKMQENIISILKQLNNRVLVESENKYDKFYTKLYVLVNMVKRDYPGLDSDRLIKYMTEKILKSNATMIYDDENLDNIEDFKMYPFKKVSYLNLNKLDENKSKEIIEMTGEDDWIFVIIKDSNLDKLNVFNKYILNKSVKIMLIQTDMSMNEVSIGPIIIPNISGCFSCLKNTDYYLDEIDLNEHIEDGKWCDFKNNLLKKYIYDEVLNYQLDYYSNFSTEYSILVGTELRFNNNKRTIKRKEIFKDPKCKYHKNVDEINFKEVKRV